MKDDDRKPIGYGFAKQVLPPGTSEEEIVKAAGNIENVIAVLYRICDRLVQEKEAKEIKRKNESVL